MKETEGRWEYLDLCRVVAIFCVVLIHVSATLVYQEPVHSFAWIINSVYFGATRFCVPLFFMVSGALLLNPEKPFSVRQFYKRNVLRLVTALLFWSAMYYVFLVYLPQPGTTWQGFSFLVFLGQVINGHPDHHWFLFVMIALYLVVPVMRSITKGKTSCRYYLGLWFLFQIILSSVRLVFAFFPPGSPAVLPVMEAVINFFGNTAPGSLMGFSGYMVLGYYLHMYPPGKKTRHILPALGAVGALLTVALTWLVSARDGATSEAFYDVYTLWTMAAALGAFLTARAMFPAVAASGNRVLPSLSVCSFGIYLVHDFFLNYANREGLAFRLPAAISAPVIALAVYIASYVVVFLIKKIPVLRDYIC